MTLLGKIFTVLILVMSVLFMGFAIMVFATHMNWREEVLRPRTQAAGGKPAGLRFQLEDLQTINKQLRSELEKASDALAREQAARRYALAALQEQKSQAENERDQAAKQLADLQAAHTQADATLQATNTRLDAMTKEVEALRTVVRNTQLDRDQQFSVAVAKTDELNAVNGMKRDLEERRDQLLAQVGRMKQVMSAFGLTENTPVAGAPPPDLDGIVLAVGDKDLIEISLGSDAGLRIGHQLHVYRDRSYLGKVVVRKTMPDRAVAEILKDYRQGTIKKGDSVATKLI
jgi:hypothetical protein